MKLIFLRCKDCRRITAYIEDEDDNSSNYKTCSYHGKHKEMKVIGSEEVGRDIACKINKLNKKIESTEELEKIMKHRTGIKEGA